MSWDFLHPGRLWLLLVVPLLAAGYVGSLMWGRRRALKFTNIELLDSILPKASAWRRHVITGLMLGGIAVGVLALAQPFREERTADNRSIIMLVLDVSQSMRSDDVDPSRFEAAKQQAAAFVEQVDPSIEIGLESFSAEISIRVPPTLNRSRVTDAIDGLDLEDGTAIGDAIVRATDELVGEFPEREPAPGTSDGSAGPISEDGPPAAIVILTDGSTIPGRIKGPEGAQEAAKARIPVYGIVFGTPEGTIPYTDPDTGDTSIEPVPVNYDELSAAAEITGGKFYKAETGGGLGSVYDDIEKTLNPALKQPEPTRVELTVRYLFVALLLLILAVALAFWLLGGLA